MVITYLTLQFITDKNEKKTAVILPIDEFLQLLEEYDDITTLVERQDERNISFEQVLSELERDNSL